ncbi:uncharacterized protein LOC122453240 [Cervus canadensis]|uniref:uncharacterized protein LOC122453240 n=1 Tax=Cervus canadensis TaxID=1574408 RepID=UPI001C9E6BCB|nr:uncharacterized protein LOC122453240 [Cervus canadensis]
METRVSASLDLPTSLPRPGPSWGACVILTTFGNRGEDPGTTVKIVNTLISMFCRDASPSADLGRFQSAGHLDSPNLLCGRYRCSPGLTSLSESADHSGRSTTETSSPCPSGSPFSQSTSAWDSRKTNFRRAERPELVPEADIVSQKTDLIIKSPGEAGEKAAWTDRASKGSATPAWDGEKGDQPGLASPGPSTS